MYDITNTPNTHANEAIKTLNRFTRDTFGVGGIFHGAIEIASQEWSFGYCPYGTGVRDAPARRAAGWPRSAHTLCTHSAYGTGCSTRAPLAHASEPPPQAAMRARARARRRGSP